MSDNGHIDERWDRAAVTRGPVRTGAKSQTVNVCTPRNVAGEYEARYRLDFVNAITDGSDLSSHTSLDDLHAWLLHRNASAEGASGEPLPAPDTVPVDTQDPWVTTAVRVVDQAIDDLVQDFVRTPYRHRVEHSLHTQLVTQLMQSDVLDAVVPIGAGPHETQLVHKEWPETEPRRGRGKTVERRGLFDVVVLSPSQLEAASLEQFRQGRIAPPIVVELGLDYGATHLDGDIEKFRNSEVLHGRLVHLTRNPTQRKEVEDLLGTAPFTTATVRSAYGYHDERNRKAVKLLSDGGVREI